MKSILSRLVVAGVLVTLSATSFAADGHWPQWRGPERTDLSKDTGLLKSWPAGGPKRVWLNENAGLGYSGVAITGGKIFTMGVRNGGEDLIVLDAKDGKELWAAKIGDVLKNGWGDGPRGTPTVDGAVVYALGGQGNLICANVADGKVLWQKSMKGFGGKTPTWGYTESVLVDGNRVVCTPGGAQGAVVALDKKNGDLLWQSKEFTDGAQYSSVVGATINGKPQYVQLTMQHFVGLDPATGKMLWSVDFPGRTAVIPTPIVSGNQVYVTAGYGVGCKSVTVNADNTTTELYMNKSLKNHHGGVILLDGHIYGHSDGDGWVCQNLKTGEQVWTEKKALGKGAIAYADGMFYCIAENDGTVALIEATTKGWSEKGRFKLDPQTTQRSPQGRIWTHPVITGGRLYLRDQELLSCYDVKAN